MPVNNFVWLNGGRGKELADKELADKELADKELADKELADTRQIYTRSKDINRNIQHIYISKWQKPTKS
jgi:hypothetical protein